MVSNMYVCIYVCKAEKKKKAYKGEGAGGGTAVYTREGVGGKAGSGQGGQGPASFSLYPPARNVG